MAKVYFVGSCPLSDLCTISFKNAKVWGYSEDDCKMKLANHYETSGNHSMEPEEAEEAAEMAELEYALPTLPTAPTLPTLPTLGIPEYPMGFHKNS